MQSAIQLVSRRRIAFTMLILAGLWLAAPTTQVEAQLPPGQHNGLWVGIYDVTGSSYILQLDSQNNATSFITTPNGPWPYWGAMSTAAMFSDNKNVVGGAAYDNPFTKGGGYLWDPQALTTTTLTSTPAGPEDYEGDGAINSDGDGVVICNNCNPPRAMTIDYTTAVHTVFLMASSTTTLDAKNGLVWDRINGGYVWSNQQGTNQLHRSNFDFSQRTVLATASGTGRSVRWGGALMQNGDWYSASSGATRVRYEKVAAGSNVFSPGPPSPSGRYVDITAEHYAKPGIGFWAAGRGNTLTPGFVEHVDPTTIPPTITSLFANTPKVGLEIVELYSNDLNTARIPNEKAKWVVNINPGNGLHAGKPFICAASLAGAGMLPLADGRELFLTPDVATFLSLGGALGPFLTGNLGTLNATGTATALLDFSSFGTNANGTVIHLAAVVTDPKAPSGIAHVCQPYAFVINIKP